MTELTQWFPATTKPVHEGYYDTSAWGKQDMVLYWDGTFWRASATSSIKNPSWFEQKRSWRGLATSPVVAA